MKKLIYLILVVLLFLVESIHVGVVAEILHEEFLVDTYRVVGKPAPTGVDPHDNYAVRMIDGSIVVMAHGDVYGMVAYRGKELRPENLMRLMRRRYGEDKIYYLDSCHQGCKAPSDEYKLLGKGCGISFGGIVAGNIYYTVSRRSLEDFDEFLLPILVEIQESLGIPPRTLNWYVNALLEYCQSSGRGVK